MNYSFIPGEISYLEVKNIKKNVVLQVFTIVCMILSFVLILVTIFLCRKYNPKCRRRRKVTSYDITSDIKKEDLSIPTISDNPPQYPHRSRSSISRYTFFPLFFKVSEPVSLLNTAKPAQSPSFMCE